MLTDSDRARVLAYVQGQWDRGFGVTAGSCRQMVGRARLSTAEARKILDRLVRQGMASVATEKGRTGMEMRVYRAVASTSVVTGQVRSDGGRAR